MTFGIFHFANALAQLFYTTVLHDQQCPHKVFSLPVNQGILSYLLSNPYMQYTIMVMMIRVIVIINNNKSIIKTAGNTMTLS